MAVLEIDNLHKRFGGVAALQGVDLALGADETGVVLGPTGAGKTTLLRTVAGLETPDAGSILLGGEEIGGWSPAARDVALVFENFSLYPGWTVRRNLEFPLRAPGRRETSSEIDERVRWAAGMLRIGHLLDRDAEQLSGGEMQRVAIGRAIVRRPRLFLMDEPLTNLDAKLREELRVELVLLRREIGLPMVYVTHDWSEALAIGDRLFVLSEGKVLQRGAPREVYERPASPAVARQLGLAATNIFPVTVAEGAVRRTGAGNAPGLEIGRVDPQSPPASAEAVLGIRPEDIDPAGGKQPARVLVVEEAGPRVTVLAEWGGEPIHLALERAADRPSPGETIYPRPRMDRAIWWPR